MSKPDYWYSTDEERFGYDCLGEALYYLIVEQPPLFAQDQVCLYVGESIRFTAGDFAPDGDDVTNTMCTYAYDKVGEISEGYLSAIGNKPVDDLTERIKQVVTQWADEHKLHPDFFSIKNVKELNFLFVSKVDDVTTLLAQDKYAYQHAQQNLVEDTGFVIISGTERNMAELAEVAKNEDK